MCDWSSCVCSSALGDVAVRDVAGSRRQEPPIPSRPIQELASVQGRRIGSRRIARLAPWNDAKVFLFRHGGDPGDRRFAPTRFGAHPASSCLFFESVGSDERSVGPEGGTAHVGYGKRRPATCPGATAAQRPRMAPPRKTGGPPLCRGRPEFPPEPAASGAGGDSVPPSL